jgi:hypothetical protein
MIDFKWQWCSSKHIPTSVPSGPIIATPSRAGVPSIVNPTRFLLILFLAASSVQITFDPINPPSSLLK